MKSFHARVKILVLNEKKVRFDCTNLYIIDKSNTLAFLVVRLILPAAAVATNLTRNFFLPLKTSEAALRRGLGPWQQRLLKSSRSMVQTAAPPKPLSTIRFDFFAMVSTSS